MQRTGWVCVWLLACGADPNDESLQYPLADLHGLYENARWVWRTGAVGAVDSGRGEAVDEDSLVWAMHQGSGEIGIRRGPTWQTGTDWGTLRFDVTGGDLLLTAWDLPGREAGRITGEGNLRMADANAADGDRHATGSYRCETLINAGAETFFGAFASTATLDCRGNADQPTGRWTFARDVGLVQLRSTTLQSLDLVAPGW
ncbi:MAG: hypothetical protein CL927_03400 [Deltaproteobacteria bacterium]|nr:hypothetical protein [Deltaproteobacteria bacterium]HCH63794.1 hypothetical protein [Deltaproteobacteria bacterium]